MHKYKVGDKVRIRSGYYAGEMVTVNSVKVGNTSCVSVQHDNGPSRIEYKANLCLVVSK